MTAGTGGVGIAVSFNSKAVGEVRNVSSQSPEVNKIDMSSHDTVQYREFVFGLADRGSIRLDGILVIGDEGQNELETTQGDGNDYPWSVTFPDGSSVSGQGACLAFDFSGPYTEAHTFTATIGISGDVTYDDGISS